jgi:ferredoxin
VAVRVPGLKNPNQVLHLDALCNACGNCESFCPYESAPYKDKLTLYATQKDFDAGENAGFVVKDAEAGCFRARVGDRTFEGNLGTEGTAGLPNTHGQVWREYDISPYTLRVTTTNRPEQAVIDWILRETGYEAWHSEPLGVLSATSRTLRVYHTPEMQAVVAGIVDRFVHSEAETRPFGLRVITLDDPSWRMRAHSIMRPVAAQTPGVLAWLLSKEDAAMLLAEMRRRTDYREHSSPHLLVSSGQSAVVSTMRSRAYIRDVVMRAGTYPGYEPQTGQVDDGLSLEFSPLVSVDSKLIDAVIKCDIDQVEKMVATGIDVPTTAAPRASRRTARGPARPALPGIDTNSTCRSPVR